MEAAELKRQEQEQSRLKAHSKLINARVNQQQETVNQKQEPVKESEVSLSQEVKPVIENVDIGRLICRINDVESSLVDMRSWKDPRNTPGRLDNMEDSIVKLSNRISQLEIGLKELSERLLNAQSVIETNIETQEAINRLNEALTPKKRGRPKKVQE